MKVYDVNLTGTSATESGRTQGTQRADRGDTTQASKEGSGGDRVELSGTSSRIAHAISSYSADRAGKVQALAQQYQSGTYQPDSVKTSQGIIAEALGSGAQ
jgi:anti-sigma28 factor (negative regulator of flagellin synthesis)